MSRSMWWLLAAVCVACAILLGLRSCADDGTPTDARGAASPTAIAATPADADAAALSASGQPRLDARTAAIRAAVSTLHQYIAALPGDDRAKADAFWVGGKPPARTGEADLRALQGPRALRLQNGTPGFIGAGEDALEIPVELRISFADAPLRRYRGWYRLRRAISGDRWEITSASIDLERR